MSPRGNHVLIKVQDKEVKSLGGILLPESAQKRPTSGQVMELGDGKTGLDKEVDFQVKPGDEVRRSARDSRRWPAATRAMRPTDSERTSRAGMIANACVATAVRAPCVPHRWGPVQAMALVIDYSAKSSV